ncbi:hypothetical protein A4S06_00540 [Erysipelotrichaceae bacterium MTC7]|nr:hypothetical protein A4S06_00540 [Erysipelotrichaceae bacterium MTC7]
MKIQTCEVCQKDITTRKKFMFTHIKCEHCQTPYELDAKSWKWYMLFPFVSVMFAMFVSIRILPTEDIFLKMLIILGSARLLYRILCYLGFYFHFLNYQVRKKSQEDL